MGWLDQLAHFKYRTKEGEGTGETASSNPWTQLKGHGKELLNVFNDWRHEQGQKHDQLTRDREEANRALDDLKSRTGMAEDQRNREISRLTKDMPGPTDVLRAHPVASGVGKVCAFPFKVGWHALKGSAAGAAVLAPRVTPSSNTLLLILAFLYHFALIFLVEPTLYWRILANLAMIFFIIVFVFDSSERNGDNYRILISLALVFEVLLPLLTTLSALDSLDFVRLYLANGLIVWTWIYYAVFVRGKDISYGPTKWMRGVIIVFWLGVLWSVVGASLVDFDDVELDTAGSEQWYAAKKVASKAWDGWGVLITGITSGFDNMSAVFSMRMKQATGEYYYGVVEENEKEPLGVYLEDIKASQNEFEEYEPVTVYATLSARTLDDAVHVNVDCYAGQEKNTISGTVYPDETFTVENLQQEELDCSFDQLPEGTNKVTYNVSFNFQTIGYLKRYFADRDAITAATRQEIDLLDEYQITDHDPVAHYTNGPVAIGMGPEQALIGVSETYTVKPRLALTLDSAHGWGGKIASLEEVVLLIPDTMSLDTTQCTDGDWEEYAVDDCVESELAYETQLNKECAGDNSCIEEQCTTQLTGYNAYTLDVAKDAYKDIEEFITISCRLNVDDVSGLLGATPIATHYFYVKTRYNYEITDDISVQVAEAEDTRASSVSGDAQKSTEALSSLQTLSKEQLLQYIFYNYGEALFSAQEEHSVYACNLAAIIAQTSSANPHYYNNGRTGLLGITPVIAAQVASEAGYSEKYDLYNPATNIDIAAAYIHNIGGQLPKEIAKTYYAGVYLITGDDSTGSNSQIDLYAALVDSYATVCADLDLQNSAIAENEVHKETALSQGNVQYDTVTETTPITLFIARSPTSSYFLNLTFTYFDESYFDAPPLHARLYYHEQEVDAVGITAGLNHWHDFAYYPTLQVQFNSSASSVFYRFFQDFVINTETLLEDQEYALISDVLFVEYDGTDIIFRLANNVQDKKDHDEICSVRWYPYTAYTTCAEDGLPGLIIRNVYTEQVTVGQGHAVLQIEWDTAKQLKYLEEEI